MKKSRDGFQGFYDIEEETREEEVAGSTDGRVVPIRKPKPANVNSGNDNGMCFGKRQMGVPARRFRERISLERPRMGDSKYIDVLSLGELPNLIG